MHMKKAMIASNAKTNYISDNTKMNPNNTLNNVKKMPRGMFL